MKRGRDLTNKSSATLRNKENHMKLLRNCFGCWLMKSMQKKQARDGQCPCGEMSRIGLVMPWQFAKKDLIEATNPNAFFKSSRTRKVPTEQ